MKMKNKMMLLKVIALWFCAILVLTGCAGKAEAYQDKYDLGVKYVSEGNYEEAILALNAAIEIDPKQAAPYLELADIYIKKSDIDNAKSTLYAYKDQVGEEVFFDSISGNEDLINGIGAVSEDRIDHGTEYKITYSNILGNTIREEWYRTNGYLYRIDYFDNMGRLTCCEIYDADGSCICKSLYDSDENMTEEWDYEASTYTKNEYVNGLLVNYEFYDLSKGTQNTKIEYEYDANGVLAKKTRYDHGNVHVIYTCDSNGNDIRADVYCSREGEGYEIGELTRYFIMTYDDNGTLLTKEEHIPDGMLFSIGYYEDGHLKKSEVYDITLPTNPLSDTFYY